MLTLEGVNGNGNWHKGQREESTIAFLRERGRKKIVYYQWRLS